MLNIFLTMIVGDHDRSNFINLYETYHKMVFYVSEQILHSNALAEEAAQEVWLKVLERLLSICEMPAEKQRAYLIVTARNMSLNILKKEKRYVSFEEETQSACCADWDEEYQHLVNIVMNLPEDYSRILELKLILEWSNREISNFLGINISTVATKIFRGRRMIIKQLKGADSDEKIRI